VVLYSIFAVVSTAVSDKAELEEVSVLPSVELQETAEIARANASINKIVLKSFDMARTSFIFYRLWELSDPNAF
jgi:hypothetical protein